MFATMAEEKIYTVKQVAALLQVDPRTIRKMIADGEIEAFTIRSEYRIKQSALDALMQRGLYKREEKEEESSE